MNPLGRFWRWPVSRIRPQLLLRLITTAVPDFQSPKPLFSRAMNAYNPGGSGVVTSAVLNQASFQLAKLQTMAWSPMAATASRTPACCSYEDALPSPSNTSSTKVWRGSRELQSSRALGLTASGAEIGYEESYGGAMGLGLHVGWAEPGTTLIERHGTSLDWPVVGRSHRCSWPAPQRVCQWRLVGDASFGRSRSGLTAPPLRTKVD